MLLLNKKVSLIVMNKDNDGNDLSKLNKKLMSSLANAFGGVTVTPAKGAWVDKNKTYIDSSNIYSMNYAGKLTNKEEVALYQAILAEFSIAKQEAVSLMYGNQLAILEPSDMKQFSNVAALA